MKRKILTIVTVLAMSTSMTMADDLHDAIDEDYQSYLAQLFDHFHRNPELSLAEHQTAARMAQELRDSGFDVTEGVGGTGIIAIMENGSGPLVMMRADMDGLPVEEKSGLENASVARQVDPITGNEVFVMHACGHDVHITSLVGTARQMAARKDEWSGTLMLLVQPAEERVLGARAMMDDKVWDAPHTGKDPIVLGSQIVLALQTLVARELSPREPGVVTVGSFHAGTKHNIISDNAHLQLTVRNTNRETRKILLEGIERIAVNMGRVAGLPEDMLPEVTVSEESVPPTVNDQALARRLKVAWAENMGEDSFVDIPTKGMGAEDFPYFTVDPEITSVYWAIGGTPVEDFELAAAGGPPVASHHSPLFKISPGPAVRAGVESTVVALMALMGD